MIGFLRDRIPLLDRRQHRFRDPAVATAVRESERKLEFNGRLRAELEAIQNSPTVQNERAALRGGAHPARH